MHRVQAKVPMAVEPAGSLLSSAGAREARRLLICGVAVLHPEETVFETSLAGWSMQMEARNLKPDWIAQSLRAVRRFLARNHRITIQALVRSVGLNSPNGPPIGSLELLSGRAPGLEL